MDTNFEFASASVSDRGLSEKRPQNEDSYLELRDLGVFAVADGVGGAQAGDVASQMAVEILGEAFINQKAGADAEETMRAAIDQANAAIFQMSNDLAQLASMATTVVALHVDGNIATIGHVGDSRLYRVDPDGGLYRETQDHSVVEEEVRAGRMTPEQAVNHPSRNVISRALGAEPTVEIDLKTIMVDPGTRFLLCSDGITRHIEDGEIGDLFAANTEPGVLCERMKEICYSRGAEDNLTAVVVKISSELAGSFAAAAGAGAAPFTSPEIEEETIATARSPFDRVAEADEEADEEQTVQNLEDLSADEELAQLRDETSEISGSLNESSYASASVVVPAAAQVEPAITSAHRVLYDDEPAENGTLASKLLPAAAFILLGTILGIAGYYFLQASSPEPQPVTPVITEQKSNNTALTAFEEGRRLVDADPAKYLNANAASPQIAEDYFLLGRAFLLTGKYWEAKRAFTEAKNKLAQVETGNAKTLALEIAMAMAIIETAGASDAFSREAAVGNPASNANTSGQPVR